VPRGCKSDPTENGTARGERWGVEAVLREKSVGGIDRIDASYPGGPRLDGGYWVSRGKHQKLRF